jgi:hypothetical protein
MDRLPRISVSGDIEGDYVVLMHRAGGVLRIAPVPTGGLPVVTSLKKTCTACPAQWEGTLDDDRALYARYRWGELSVGLGKRIEDAIDNGRSEEALFCEHVGDGLDGLMGFEELRGYLWGLLDFPPDLEVKGEREPFSALTETSHKRP